jgi:alkylhydroperoxidase/carboxymuconolactone decarboxylase family protein YurZ
VGDYRAILRKLALRDDALVESILDRDEASELSGLDGKTWALVRLGALIAVDAAPASYLEAVDAARAAGATDDEIVGSLVSVVTLIGVPRAVSAAPKLSLAVGYDVEAGLERFEDE